MTYFDVNILTMKKEKKKKEILYLFPCLIYLSQNTFFQIHLISSLPSILSISNPSYEQKTKQN